jgi:hypothetical protein
MKRTLSLLAVTPLLPFVAVGFCATLVYGSIVIGAQAAIDFVDLMSGWARS